MKLNINYLSVLNHEIPDNSSFIAGIKLFTKAELITIYGKRTYAKKSEAAVKFNRSKWVTKMRNPTKYVYSVNAFPIKFDNILAHRNMKYHLKQVHQELTKLVSSIIELGILTLRNVPIYYYKILIETNGNSRLDTDNRLITYRGINSFKLISKVTKYVKRILTNYDSHSVYSSIENKVNGYDTEVKVHSHLLLRSNGKLTNSDINSIRSKIFNRYGSSIQLHIEPFTDYDTHSQLVLTSSSDASEVVNQLMIGIRYLSKQGTKLPIVKSLTEARKDASNPNFTQLIRAIYLSQTGIRIKSAEQFSRVIKSNLSEIKLYFDNLHRRIRNQLITAKFSFKRDGSVSTVSIATVPSPRNDCHVVILKNATSLGLLGSTSKNSNKKEVGEIRFQLLDNSYVVYLNSS